MHGFPPGTVPDIPPIDKIQPFPDDSTAAILLLEMQAGTMGKTKKQKEHKRSLPYLKA